MIFVLFPAIARAQSDGSAAVPAAAPESPVPAMATSVLPRASDPAPSLANAPANDLVTAVQAEPAMSAENDRDGIKERVASRLERLEAAVGRRMLKGTGMPARHSFNGRMRTSRRAGGTIASIIERAVERLGYRPIDFRLEVRGEPKSL